jgi:hypothetical protein
MRIIYELINEIDARHESRMTEKVKRYMEKSMNERGEIMPTRIDRLLAMVLEVYAYVTRPRDKVKIYFKEEGSRRLGYIVFERSGRIWQTSEIGSGYTTACRSEPPWLRDIIDKLKGWKLANKFIGWEDQYRLEWITKGKFKGHRYEIIHVDRRHENGQCWYYVFKFDTIRGADEFGRFLKEEAEKFHRRGKKEIVSLITTPYEHILEWQNLPLVDKKYRIFAAWGNKYDDYIENFCRKHGIDTWDLWRAINDYIKEVEDKIRKMIRDEVDKRLTKHPRDFPSPYDYIKYYGEVRSEVVVERWDEIEKILERFEEKIAEKAKEYRMKEKAKRRDELDEMR